MCPASAKIINHLAAGWATNVVNIDYFLKASYQIWANIMKNSLKKFVLSSLLSIQMLRWNKLQTKKTLMMKMQQRK